MDENDISYKIRGAIFDVYNGLGTGLLESVYVAVLGVVCPADIADDRRTSPRKHIRVYLHNHRATFLRQTLQNSLQTLPNYI